MLRLARFRLALRWRRRRPRAGFRAALSGLLAGPLVALASLSGGPAQAATYTLAIEPSDSSSRLEQLYRPLIAYLARETGETFQLKVAPNFLAHWQRIKKGDSYDFIIDSAHLTDYRTANQGYTPLVHAVGDVTYSIVTTREHADLTPNQLITKEVACQGPPSMPYLLLSKLFPNPIRQPKLVPVESVSEALDSLRSGTVTAAVIPTRIAKTADDLHTVEETEAVPNLTLSAAPSVPAHLRARMIDILMASSRDPDLADLLTELGIPELEPAAPTQVQGQSRLLEGMWGF